MRSVLDMRSRAERDIRIALLAGVASVVLLAGGVGGIAATTELSGAVIAPGVLVVDSTVKKVQHPTGGIVGEVRVRNGDQVRMGDVLVRLDETITQANLAIIVSNMTECLARRARLEAERDGRAEISFPPERLRAEGDTARVLEGERELFLKRRTMREGQKAQLRERVGQLRQQINGNNEQIAAKEREIELIYRELEGVRDLWRKNLIQIQRVTSLERDAARLEGERGALKSSLAQTQGKITETELQIISIDETLQSEVGKELSEIRAKLSELAERRVTAEDQLKRTEIRAPQDGVVHQSTVFTVGGVIGAGDAIMLIVPATDTLTVEARLAPQAVDQVRIKQPVVARFPSFNRRTTPEINGFVETVAADLSTDQRTGAQFYTLRITLPPSEITRLKALRLVPGMPVESFVQTENRTVLSFFTKPLMDQVTRAFREK